MLRLAHVPRVPRCVQPSIEEKSLDAQMMEFLDQISLPPSVVDWIIKIMKKHDGELQVQANERRENHTEEARKLERQMSNLTDLRIRELT